MNRQRQTGLKSLLEGMVEVPAEQERPLTGLALDSRAVRPGDLFIAVPGIHADGRRFVPQAVERGAAAVLYEGGEEFDFSELGVPALTCTGLRSRLGEIADRFFGHPSRKLQVIGVTGTNGKTTCTQLLARALNAAGRRCAVMGTIGYGFPGALQPATHTTPDPITVHRLLAEFHQAGAEYACIEVSSHALEQGRVQGVDFHMALFTNLSRDHLDYHGDMEAYGAAKALLFDRQGLRFAVINQDDAFGRRLLQRLRRRGDAPRLLSFGLEGGDVRASELSPQRDGLRLRVRTRTGEIGFHSPLFGRFNGSNLVAALAVLLACGLDAAKAAACLARVEPVQGRMERFGGNGDRPLVVVDYAQTPDALEQALSALREHTRGALWCVFGCGGDRDRGKRPQMGDVAERLADVVVLTNDNPRNEPPARIFDDILAGMARRPEIIPDRAEAIRFAIGRGRPSDTVLVAGKGHESYQEAGGRRRPYSDRDTVRRILGEAA